MRDFKEELSVLLNSCSMENGSNTPDFILAEYMMNCLEAFEKASNAREKWYGKNLTITENLGSNNDFKMSLGK